MNRQTDQQTDRPADIATYRAAIEGRNEKIMTFETPGYRMSL